MKVYYRHDTLNSEQIKVSMDHNHRENDRRMTETLANKFEIASASNDDGTSSLNDKLDKIIKIIHARIEEKYRDFR